MHTYVLWLLLLAPLVLLISSAALLRYTNIRLSLVKRVTVALGVAISSLGLLAVALAIKFGPLESELLGAAGIGISIYTDVFSSTIYGLVAMIGTIVMNYSFRYLSGDLHQRTFLTMMAGAVASVLVAVIAGNLLLFIGAMVSTHYFLNKLLLHYGDRPLAVLAARKRWVVSRLAEALLILVATLFYAEFGSLQIGDLLSKLQLNNISEGYSEFVLVATISLCFISFLLSALLPFHGWLLEVMETPTPVSALLHAGIVNAGGFLLIRFSPLLEQNPLFLNLIVAFGAVSAVLAILMMMVQPGVKLQLAYSTIAQMGFMIMECGLGAYHIAAMHIVLHSAYKAHLFLSSGDVARTRGLNPQNLRSLSHSLLENGLWIVASVLIVFFVGEILVPGDMDPNLLTLHLIFAVGASSLLMQKASGARVQITLHKLFIFALCTTLYFGLQHVAGLYFSLHNYAHSVELTSLEVGFRFALVTLFALNMFLATNMNLLMRFSIFQKFYVLLVNGFYINLIVNKWAVAYWFGPSKFLASTYTRRLFKKAEVLK